MNAHMHKDNSMAGNTENGGGRRGSRLRVGFWAAPPLILLVPLVAMQFSHEWNWDLFDFIVWGVLLFGAGLAYELVARKTGTIWYRAAAGVAVATAVILVCSR